MLDFIIIADGGGTKTKAMGIRSHDDAAFEAFSGSCVPVIDMVQALQAVDDIVTQLLQNAAIDRKTSRIGISLACAGLDDFVSRSSFTQQLEARVDAVNLSNDGIAALNACVGRGPGAVVAIGTGVVTAARTSSTAELIFDGWGWPAGDRGGGAWIGRNAVELFLEALDYSNTGLDALFDAMSCILGRDRDAVARWLASAERRDYAALAQTVVNEAQHGSETSRQLLQNAASHIGRIGTVLTEQHGIGALYITGGLAGSLTPYLDPKQFQLFPNATFAGAWLGAANWLREFGSAHVQGIQQ